MAGINMASIIAKAQRYMESPKMKSKVQNVVDEIAFGVKVKGGGIHSVEDAGFKFADVLLRTIQTSGLDASVADAISHVDVGGMTKLKDGTYLIRVYISPQERESMSTLKSYPSVDLVELYNDGVDHVMRQIFEHEDNGALKVSRTVIPGTHFMEQAVVDFMGNYSSEYNVISIDINRG